MPSQYIGFLGFIPIALGIKAIFDYRKEKRKRKAKIEQEGAEKTSYSPKRTKRNFEILSVIGITIANGADNIGVYIPLFTGYNSRQLIIAVLIFAALLAVWCFVGIKAASLPAIKNKLEKYKHIIVPIIFIALGVYIMVRSGLFLLFAT